MPVRRGRYFLAAYSSLFYDKRVPAELRARSSGLGRCVTNHYLNGRSRNEHCRDLPRRSAPRGVSDRVNAVIKFREFWRPFCPSMTPVGSERYLAKYTHAPFMVLAFQATGGAAEEVPTVVHVDGSCRPQIVEADNARYFELIQEFEKISGVP